MSETEGGCGFGRKTAGTRNAFQGVAALVVGMRVEDAIKKIKGIKCGFKPTSCPDQLALALEEMANS